MTTIPPKLAGFYYTLHSAPGKEKQGPVLTYEARIRMIVDMERAETKYIAAYLKDLEEGCIEWAYRGPSTLGDLSRLQKEVE